MKRTLISLLIVISLIFTGFSISTVSAKKSQVDFEEINKLFKFFPQNDFTFIEENDNKTMLATMGPITNFFTISDVNLIDGDPVKIMLIQFILDNNIPFLRPYVSINVSNITFSIKYTINIPQLPLINRYSYATIIDNNENESYGNVKHTLIVTGFEGEFGFLRMKPIRLFPAYFIFFGTCDEFIILT